MDYYIYLTPKFLLIINRVLKYKDVNEKNKIKFLIKINFKIIIIFYFFENLLI